MRGKIFRFMLAFMFLMVYSLDRNQPGQAAFEDNPVLQNSSSLASSVGNATAAARETASEINQPPADAAAAIAAAGTAVPLYGPVSGDINLETNPVPLLAVPDAPALVSPANGATGVSTNATLTVHASDPDGGTLKVSFYGRQKTTTTSPNFSLAAIPDTQNYVIDSGVAAYFNAITRYIVDHQAERNFAFVTDMGDITNTGDTDTDDSEWIFADTAYSILDRSSSTYTDDVPYSMMPGNHDYLGNSLSHFESHFGVARFSGRPYYGGHYGSDNSNSYSLFSVSGMHFIVINLACVGPTPSSAVLNWADSLLKDDLSRRGIVACHTMLEPNSTFSSVGSAVFNALKDNPNLILLLAGHAGVGRRSDLGSDGHTINTVMADYSTSQNGGNGWFRIMEFQPANNQIQVYTYSPTQNNNAGGYLTGSTHEFAIIYNMRSPDFNLISTVPVPSGSNASVTWSNLAGSTEYEWYAVARDADNVTLGTTQSFTTGTSIPTLRAFDDVYTTPEDTQLQKSAPGVLINDTKPDQAPLTAVKVSNPGHGTVTLSSNGSFNYSPEANYVGTDSFTYKANNGTADSNVATVTITVDPVNDAPVCQVVNRTTNEDTTLSVSPACTDVDGDSLTYSVVSQPAHGTVSGTPSALNYTPAANYNGPDSFTYKANDGKADSNVATVTITVNPVNDAPVCRAVSLTTSEDTSGSASPLCTDVDGDSLTYSVVSQPTHGDAVWSNGKYQYSPDADYSGTDSFTYKANDGKLDSSAAAVNVTVSPVNDAPVCQGLSMTTPKNMAKETAPVCQDIDSASLSYVIDVNGQHGSASVVAGKLKYQPGINYTGEDHFSYKAYDGSLYSSSAQVTINITPFDYPPVLGSLGSPRVPEDTWLEFTATATDVDTAQALLAFSLSGDIPAGAAMSKTGDFRWKPAEEQGPGSYSFKVCVSDGVTGLVCKDMTVQVDEANLPPVLAEISDQQALKNKLLTFTVTAQDADLPANTLTFRMDPNGAPAGASIDPATGVFTWKPGFDQALTTYSVNICVSDGTEPVCQVVKIQVREAVYLPLMSR